jgi:hypothetical protein
MTIGLYTPQQIEVTEIVEMGLGSNLEPDLGLLASVKSRLPGFVVSPIVKTFLDNAGYIEKNTDGLTLYQGFLDAGSSKKVPVIVRIDGNRTFAAISGNESYAETLITSINK